MNHLKIIQTQKLKPSVENQKKLMVDKAATMKGGSVKLKKSTQKHRYNIVSFKLFNTFHALMNYFFITKSEQSS